MSFEFWVLSGCLNIFQVNLALSSAFTIFVIMRVVIQRVCRASVTINSACKAAIDQGLLILIGIEPSDNEDDAFYLANKIVHLRIFDDDGGVMNRSILDIHGNILIVSQFTLHASTRKGNRPSYINAAKPDIAIPLYELFCGKVSELLQKDVSTGEFGADMKVELVNDGPVTIIMDSKNKE